MLFNLDSSSSPLHLYPTDELALLIEDAMIEGECYAVSRNGEHWKTGYYARESAIDEARSDWGWRQIITARVTALGLVDLDVEDNPDGEDD